MMSQVTWGDLGVEKCMPFAIRQLYIDGQGR